MNNIHPTAIIDERVKIGDNNVILPYTVITGPAEIGDNNIIGPHVVIGSPGEDTKNPRYDDSNSQIFIGNNNIIREFTAIQKPCYRDATTIGNSTFMMHGVHIPHDATVQDQVTITPLVVLGGITTLLRGANVGMGAVLHQFSIVGHFSMVAAGASVVKNIKPFGKFIPTKPMGVNVYAIKKYGFEEHIDEIHRYVLEGQLPTSEVVLAIVEEYEKMHKDSGRKQYL